MCAALAASSFSLLDCTVQILLDMLVTVTPWSQGEAQSPVEVSTVICLTGDSPCLEEFQHVRGKYPYKLPA